MLLLRPSRRTDTTPIFCVPGIGGSVAVLVPLAQLLASDRPVYGTACVGLNPGCEPDRTMTDMVDRYLREMRAVWPQGPYYLVGHSHGGIVAHAMAQRLEADGERVGFVGFFDTQFPTERTTAALPPEVALNLVSRALSFPQPYTPSVALDWDDQCEGLLQEGRAAGVLPEGFSRSHLQRIVDLYAINLRIASQFHAAPIRAPLRLLVVRDGAAIPYVDDWLRLGGPGSDVTQLDVEHHFALLRGARAETAAVVAGWARDADAATGQSQLRSSQSIGT